MALIKYLAKNTKQFSGHLNMLQIVLKEKLNISFGNGKFKITNHNKNLKTMKEKKMQMTNGQTQTFEIKTSRTLHLTSSYLNEYFPE